MKKLTVNPGDRFNQLTVIEMTGVNAKGFSVASCRCDCGKIVEARIAELRSGHKSSCGCGQPQEISKRKSKEIVGQKFGRLTVVEGEAGKDDKSYRLIWCVCDCGKKVKVRQAHVLYGLVQSCGCLHTERLMISIAKAQAANVTHGLSGTLTGQSWQSMVQRCYNPKSTGFEYYGAIGIKCCEALRISPLNLIMAIGERPSKHLSIDRIDNDEGYHCGQCGECLSNGWTINIRWATAKEQANNRGHSKPNLNWK